MSRKDNKKLKQTRKGSTNAQEKITKQKFYKGLAQTVPEFI